MSAITALTAQNTLGVRSIHAVPAQMLADQIDAVVEDIGVDAVKIGMLHSAETVQTVALAIQRHALQQAVLDPVMVATAAAVLIEQSAVDVLVRQLFPSAPSSRPIWTKRLCWWATRCTASATWKTPPPNCCAWVRKPCWSKAGTWLARWWRTCWPCPRAKPCGCVMRASTRQHARHRLHPVQRDCSAVGFAAAAGASRAIGTRLYPGCLAAWCASQNRPGQRPLNHGFAPQPMLLRRRLPGV